MEAVLFVRQPSQYTNYAAYKSLKVLIRDNFRLLHGKNEAKMLQNKKEVQGRRTGPEKFSRKVRDMLI